LSLAVAFLETAARLDYGARLQRLRWRRLARAAETASWRPADPAGPALGRAPEWLVVLDPAALPIPSPAPPSTAAGRVVFAAEAAPADPPHVHTVRELEGARLTRRPTPAPAAIAFRAADFPAAPSETVGAFLRQAAVRAEVTH